MKSKIIKILIFIAVIIVCFNIYIYNNFTNISQIEYYSSYLNSRLEGVPYTITIDKEGKVTLSNHEESKEYHYEVTYRGDKELYDQLLKMIRKKRFAFFEPAFSDHSIIESTEYKIIVTADHGKFKNGGYEPRNKKLKMIRNCIFEYIESNGNDIILSDFYGRIDKIDLQKREDSTENRGYFIIENT